MVTIPGSPLPASAVVAPVLRLNKRVVSGLQCSTSEELSQSYPSGSPVRPPTWGPHHPLSNHLFEARLVPYKNIAQCCKFKKLAALYAEDSIVKIVSMGVGNTCIKYEPWTPTPAKSIKPGPTFKYNKNSYKNNDSKNNNKNSDLGLHVVVYLLSSLGYNYWAIRG
uniref:Uncharacterized protein n=1 Tax=Romanomermis culicivorax TaxID=13658 RepID=A0A915LA68_ROMCU